MTFICYICHSCCNNVSGSFFSAPMPYLIGVHSSMMEVTASIHLYYKENYKFSVESVNTKYVLPSYREFEGWLWMMW